MQNFVHLHVHTQYSILDGLSNIPQLIDKAKDFGMPAVAITDHGNMYGVLDFFNSAKKAGIKPILGCEAYVAEGSRFDKNVLNSERARGFHCILLSKNLIGYHNLCKLISYGFKEGFYYNSRIDREIMEKYSEGLIVSTACLAGEIPFFIRNGNLKRAEEAIKWYKGVFGDDFYMELMDHGIKDQKLVNANLIALSKKYDVKLIATNDVHYIDAEDRVAHDILICINTASDYDDPNRLRYTGQEYFKTYNEMYKMFADIPEALENTLEIADKVEEYSILMDHVIVPSFPIPESYSDENDYLKYLTYKGAEEKYGVLTDEIKQRLEYELSVINKMGFSGYFLIVQDYINHSRKEGVIVGPGRGSAAGSAVAYAVGITNLDPIKYNLLFERFLNPERVSMPDIDVDFDDAGREKVFDYVVNKYGYDHVAQIVTFGTMASKLAIRDVGRVFKMPLSDVDRICKEIPDKAKDITEALKISQELAGEYNSENSLIKKVIDYAIQLEGAVRQTGVHACGVIIGPEDLTNHIPLATAKDSKIMVTQIEGSKVESAGMLKMDFLGLKTLSIIKDALENIYQRTGEKIDINSISLNDEATYKLFQEGATVGVFQFESPGMQKYLKDLEPENIEDLIAMNALYRPGPMNFIPLFIDRKCGRQKVEYPHPYLEKILKPTYGIMVYQEQIMQVAQACAGFSLGKADELRRAMGKKKMDVMMSKKQEFITGSVNNNIEKSKAEEIFDIMVKFAQYGFNRSHAAAYSVIAYQTAYLKAHYPAEYMAAVLTHHLNDIKKITFFIEECHRLGIDVAGPDINESYFDFGVNKEGQILFGLAAIKGVGMAAIQEITQVRKESGTYKDILDFLMRVDLRTVNKKTIESLAAVGAFDSFPNVHRAQFFYQEKEDSGTFLDNLLFHVNNMKNRQNVKQLSLFGDTEHEETINIQYPVCQEFKVIQKLKLEKEGIGFYISGHPLDQYKLTMKYFTNSNISKIQEFIEHGEKMSNLIIGCLVSNYVKGYDKNGREYARITVEDYQSSMTIVLFSEDYLKYKHLFEVGTLLFIKGNIVARYRGETIVYNYRVVDIALLETILDKNTKNILMKINSNEVEKNYVDTLYELVKNNPGNCGLTIDLFDISQKINVLLRMTTKVGVLPSTFTNELIKYNYKFVIL